jgi:hypothetical protein
MERKAAPYEPPPRKMQPVRGRPLRIAADVVGIKTGARP